MLGKNKGESVKYKNIKHIIKKINKKNIEDRITVLGLRPDRADVIIHASKIYLSCMKWSGAKKNNSSSVWTGRWACWTIV